jgi:hypothetical protein
MSQYFLVHELIMQKIAGKVLSTCSALVIWLFSAIFQLLWFIHLSSCVFLHYHMLLIAGIRW